MQESDNDLACFKPSIIVNWLRIEVPSTMAKFANCAATSKGVGRRLPNWDNFLAELANFCSNAKANV